MCNCNSSATYTDLRNRFSRKLKCDVGRGRTIGASRSSHIAIRVVSVTFQKAQEEGILSLNKLASQLRGISLQRKNCIRRSRTKRQAQHQISLPKKCIFNMHEERGAYIMLCAQSSVSCSLPKTEAHRREETGGWATLHNQFYVMPFVAFYLCLSLTADVSASRAEEKRRIFF